MKPYLSVQREKSCCFLFSMSLKMQIQFPCRETKECVNPVRSGIERVELLLCETQEIKDKRLILGWATLLSPWGP